MNIVFCLPLPQKEILLQFPFFFLEFSSSSRYEHCVLSALHSCNFPIAFFFFDINKLLTIRFIPWLGLASWPYMVIDLQGFELKIYAQKVKKIPNFNIGGWQISDGYDLELVESLENSDFNLGHLCNYVSWSFKMQTTILSPLYLLVINQFPSVSAIQFTFWDVLVKNSVWLPGDYA